VSNVDIILGKYLGLLSLLILAILMITLMPLSLLSGGALDNGKLIANLIALLLLVTAFTATGLYMSTIASHPAVAAMGTFGTLLLLWILDWSAGLQEQRSELFEYLSLLRHFQNIQSGLISSVDICYFILFTASFIILSIHSLANERLQK
jgi:ABC-2 type transport system permease protein